MPRWQHHGSLQRLDDPSTHVLVVTEHRPITDLVRVAVDPGGEVDRDWCDVDPDQGIVFISQVLLPEVTRAAPAFTIHVEYEAPDDAILAAEVS